MNIGRIAVNLFATKEVKQVLTWLDGKKTLIGLLLTLLPGIFTSITDIISSAGGDTSDFVKVAGAIMAFVGMVHKFLKS